MKKFTFLDDYIDKAFKGDTILQLDVRKPFVFLFTIYGHFEKEVLRYSKDNMNFVRWLWFEIDY